MIRRKEEIPWACVLRGTRLSVRVCPDSYKKRIYTWGERIVLHFCGHESFAHDRFFIPAMSTRCSASSGMNPSADMRLKRRRAGLNQGKDRIHYIRERKKI